MTPTPDHLGPASLSDPTPQCLMVQRLFQPRRKVSQGSTGLGSGFTEQAPLRCLYLTGLSALGLIQGAAKRRRLFISLPESEHEPPQSSSGVGRGGPSETHRSGASGYTLPVPSRIEHP